MFRLAALAAAVFALALVGTVENRSSASSPTPGPTVSRSVVGTILKYDPASHTLSLGAQSGTLKFVLTDATPIRLGSKVLKPQDLAAHKGSRAKVRYVDDGGKRTVESVMVAAASEAFAPPDQTISGH